MMKIFIAVHGKVRIQERNRIRIWLKLLISISTNKIEYKNQVRIK